MTIDYQFKDLVTYFQFEVSGDTMAAQLGEVCCNQPRFPRRASGQNCRFLVIFRENFSLKMCLDFLPFTIIKIPKRNTCTWSCLTRIFDRSHQTHSIPLPLSGMMISNSYLITLSLLYIHIVFTWHHLKTRLCPAMVYPPKTGGSSSASICSREGNAGLDFSKMQFSLMCWFLKIFGRTHVSYKFLKSSY